MGYPKGIQPGRVRGKTGEHENRGGMVLCRGSRKQTAGITAHPGMGRDQDRRKLAQCQRKFYASECNLGPGIWNHSENVGPHADPGKVAMAKKKLNENEARIYWEMGLSDEMIASRCEVRQYAVQDWRVKNNLCPNRGNAVSKKEAAAMLPKIGEEVRRVPGFLKMKGKAEPAPWVGTVIAVNEKRLTYTVRFENGLIETYKVI